MKRFLKNLALWLLIPSLPLQNLHALAMPIYYQGDQVTTVQQQSHYGDVAEHDDDHQTPDIDLTCNCCDMCHACSAPAISSNILGVSLAIVATLQATPSSSITLFIPEQPQRPPRA